MKSTDKSAAPGFAATPKAVEPSTRANGPSGAFPNGGPGAAESILTEPHDNGARGDERIRTAVCVHGAFDTNRRDAIPMYIGHRLACLADGEGHFAIEHRPRKSRSTGIFNRPVNPIGACGFYVQQRADDRQFLETFQRITGLGRIYEIVARPTPGRRNNPKVRWSVHRAAECLELVRIFDDFPLWSRKAVEYELWREAVIKWNGSRAIEPEEWAAWRAQIRGMRVYKP